MMHREQSENINVNVDRLSAGTLQNEREVKALGRVLQTNFNNRPVIQVVTDEGIVTNFDMDDLFGNQYSFNCDSICKKYHLKVEINKRSKKANSLAEEAAILRHLTDQGCMTAPKFYWDGQVELSVFQSLLIGLCILFPKLPIEFPSHLHVLVSEYIGNSNTITKPVRMDKPQGAGGLSSGFKGNMQKLFMSDLLCVLMEQKALGVHQGDLKPDNIRCCPERKRMFLIDYDQATFISEEVQGLNDLDFIRWCDEYANEKYDHQTAFAYFSGIIFEKDIEPCFVNGVFNVGETSMFKLQETTLHTNKIYHTWNTPHVFAQGERALDERIPWLDQVSFAPNERILDVGCNAGLLSRYLDQRGCKVTGIDIDPNVIAGANILANIHGYNTEFYHVDLDHQPILGSFDTVMLFSVIHHTDKIFANCKKVASCANRILIECRFGEGGAKSLFDGSWIATTTWNYSSLDAMRQGLEGFFKGFNVKQTFGPGDRNRYLLELVKVQ